MPCSPTGANTSRAANVRHKADADAEALRASARWYRDMADKAHAELEKLGEIDMRDEFGYLA